MNIRKLLFASAVALCCTAASAQNAEETTIYKFTPHFYGQLQVGGQETLGEGSFGKLFSPNAQIAFGYQFTPAFGMRLGVNSWQSKATMEFTPVNTQDAAAQALMQAYDSRYYWKWNYVAPAVDLTLNLTNTLFGFNPERVVDWNLFAGVGVNVAWKNNEAVAYNNALQAVLGEKGLEYIWDGTKTRFLGRFGTMVDFRVSKRVSLGLELQANVLSDHYNSKKAGNADWYFNGLVGVKYTFGKTYKKEVIVNEPVVVERVVERVVEVPVEVVREVVREVPAAAAEPQYECAIFFSINSSRISGTEMQKVRDLVDYLNAHPSSNVNLMGYADKGTGNAAINVRLSRKRTESVYNTLVNEFGINPSRITTNSMDAAQPQPFEVNNMNRVVICVAE